MKNVTPTQSTVAIRESANNATAVRLGRVAAPSSEFLEDPERAEMDSIVIALLENVMRANHGERARTIHRFLPSDLEDFAPDVRGDENDERNAGRIASKIACAMLPATVKCPPTMPRLSATELENNGRIVIAEDDEVTRNLLDRIFTRAGFTVHACENGQLACDAVRRDGADVVLLDWMMPIMDGPTAVAHLKANLDTRGIPIVMLTSQSESNERVLAFETGVQDFLTKPFETRELVARIEQQVRWREMLASIQTQCSPNG